MDKTFWQFVKQHGNKIKSADHDEDGYWVYLKAGWCWDTGGLHTVHEDTIAEIKRACRWIRPCHCADCKAGLD